MSELEKQERKKWLLEVVERCSHTPEHIQHLRSHKRYNSELNTAIVYPYRADKLCRCGCGLPVAKGRRFYASDRCVDAIVYHLQVLKGDAGTIRFLLYYRDGRVCNRCKRQTYVEAHHKHAVVEGGGISNLTNYESLCLECHKEETRALAGRRAQARKLNKQSQAQQPELLEVSHA